MVGEICRKLNLSLSVERAAAELLSELGGEVVEGVEDDVLAAAAVYACALAADEFRSLAEVSRAAGVSFSRLKTGACTFSVPSRAHTRAPFLNPRPTPHRTHGVEFTDAR